MRLAFIALLSFVGYSIIGLILLGLIVKLPTMQHVPGPPFTAPTEPQPKYYHHTNGPEESNIEKGYLTIQNDGNVYKIKIVPGNTYEIQLLPDGTLKLKTIAGN